MRIVTALLISLGLFAGMTVLGQEKKAPPKITMTAKTGNVTYDHAAHVKREKNDCKVCHDKLWPQDAKAPVNFKAAMHKTAEAAKTSCATCHVEGGKAFASKGNCAKCHVKGGGAAAKS